MKLAIITAIAALSLASTAIAEVRLTATIDGPAANAKFIAARSVWNCAGATCVASIAPDDSAGVFGCQDLARKVGHVASYATETKSLDAKALERCNKSAATPAAIGTASR